MSKNIKLKAGQKFGKLTVLKLDHIEDRTFNSKYEKSGKRILHLEFYLCECECGNKTVVEKSHLRKKVNATKSCGCAVGTHHLSNSRIWKIWAGIKRRCYYEKVGTKSFKSYQNRGITVCDEWKNNFMAFYNWALSHGYNDNLTIDRINNNGNYEPDNCRWADKRTQSLNTSRNVRISFEGKMLTIKEVAEKMGLKYCTLYMRLKRKGSK